MTGGERLQEGQLCGRYRITRLIGEGGMGAVYEAIHPGLKKRVAIKVLLPRFAEKQEARLRFLREGEAAARINHPNVVSIFDVGTEDQLPYLVMEYLEGRTLGDFLAERGALDVEEAVALLLPILSAVGAGHDCGVVHRDLKPQNIFLSPGRWGELIPKVLDFGVSKLVDDQGPAITRTQAVLGTASYMSPEQARGAANVDARSDQFALGLILYEMLTGQRAHRGENDLEILYNVASGAIQPASELRAGLPIEVHALLARMLAMAPAARFPSLRDSARALLPMAHERTRMALARGFDATIAPDVDGTGAVVQEVPSAAPAEAPASDDAPRTLVFPVAAEEESRKENTTLRHAAIESPRKKSTDAWALRPAVKKSVALGAAMVALGAVLIWNAARSGQATSTAAPVVKAPATAVATAPEVPRPPAPVLEVPAAAPAAPTPAAAVVPFEIRAFPAHAELALDGRQPARGRLAIVLPLAGPSHEIRVTAPGYVTKRISLEADQTPPSEIRLERAAVVTERPVTKKALRPARVPETARGTNNALIIK